MFNNFLVVTFSFALSVSVAMADSIATKNEQRSLNTNPEFDIYPGQRKDLDVGIEAFSAHRIKELFEILQGLRSNDIKQVIKMLEAKLKTESEALQGLPEKGPEAKQILKLVEDYNRHYMIE